MSGLYVTYCTAAKTTDLPFTTPQGRYWSDRVAYVYELAKSAGKEFAILSGEFGILMEYYTWVPNYDHLMSWKETPAMAKRVAAQLKELGITEVTFWYNKREKQEPARAVHRYEATMIEACQEAGIPFSSMPIEEKLGGEIKEPAEVPPAQVTKDPETGEEVRFQPWHPGLGEKKPSHAPTKYPPKGVSMNKKAERTYLLRAQDEKGLWQDVRKSAFLPDLQIKAQMLVKKFPNRKVEIKAEAEKMCCHCAGHGSSFHEEADKCSLCKGTGLHSDAKAALGGRSYHDVCKKCKELDVPLGGTD